MRPCNHIPGRQDHITWLKWGKTNPLVVIEGQGSGTVKMNDASYFISLFLTRTKPYSYPYHDKDENPLTM